MLESGILSFRTPGYVSDLNSTTTALNNSQTFTGQAEPVYNFRSVMVACKTDQSGLLYMEFSLDGTNWDGSLMYEITAGLNEVHSLRTTRKFFRVRFLNNSGANQTYLRLQTTYSQSDILTSPLNSLIQKDADAIIVRCIDEQTDIASSKFQGHSIVNKFGRNPDISTASVPEDLQNTGGTMSWPTAAQTLEVFSSSVDDTSAGTGARTMFIQGLDSNYLEISETVTLNGITPVLTSKSFLRAHTARIVTAGSNGVNAGTITVRQSVTTANVLLTMVPTTNQTNNAAYTVPANKTGYLRRVSAFVRSNTVTNAAGCLYIRNFGEVFRQRRPFVVNNNCAYKDEIYGGLVLNEKTDLTIRITSCSSNNTEISGGYDLILLDN